MSLVVPPHIPPKEGWLLGRDAGWEDTALDWLVLVMGAAGTVTSSPTDGRQERVMFDKITSRIQKLCYGLNADFVDPVSLLSPAVLFSAL